MTCELPWSQTPHIDAYQRAARSRGCGQLIPRHIWEGPGLSTLPQRAPGASVARLTRNKGGWKFSATPGTAVLRKTTNMHNWRAKRPTLRGTPLRSWVGGRWVVRHLQQQVQCAGGGAFMLHPTQFGLILASWLLDAVTVPPFCVSNLLDSVANAPLRAFMLLFLAQLLYSP